MISPSVEYAIQVNETQSKRLATKKPIPVNRIGIEAGAGFDLTDFYKSAPYLGFFFEKDYVSGVRQYERKYEQEIRGVLFGKKDVTAAFDNDTKKVAIYKKQMRIH
ncbi:hypothetical protein KKH82_05705 [Patescibacteria group bacterium]|nr:hypothetical protein [Patescibacteria group bacterium]